jgi:quercetin dioxygenase-like cupin family protein
MTSKIVMREPVGEISEPKISLYIFNLSAGQTLPSHADPEALFAYVLQGNVENQIEPEPPRVYRQGGVFQVRPKQIHSLLRNLSQTEPARLLILQIGALGSNVKPLIQEPLENIANQEVSVITLVAPAGSALRGAHKHPGPVFAYVVKGEIENQVDPDPPKVYRAGDVFYEPPMHSHRIFRNVSKESAEVVLFQAGEKGQPPAMIVEQ